MRAALAGARPPLFLLARIRATRPSHRNAERLDAARCRAGGRDASSSSSSSTSLSTSTTTTASDARARPPDAVDDDDDDAPSSSSSALLRTRVRGKHLDRPWHLTYLRKRGVITAAQKRALRGDPWRLYGFEIVTHSGGAGPPPRLDLFRDVFPDATPRRDGDALITAKPPPVVLEIGFGLGDSLTRMCERHPERCFLGAEVHKPGVHTGPHTTAFAW